ncbi:MAG: hypothetical protein ACK2T0_15720 [Anaerolineales bacterium]|jgi:hypothetical protein
MTRPLEHPHDLSSPKPAAGLGTTSLQRASRTGATVAFRLGLASLAIVLFGCMTVTRILNPGSAAPGGQGTAATPMASQLPVFEHDYNKTIQLIASGQTSRLVELSAEGQQPPMYQAGTQSYTVSMAGSEIIDLGYDWCTKTGAILSDNMKHITVSVSINGYEIPAQDFQAIDWSAPAGSDPQFPDGLVCHSWVTLATHWPAGDYQVVETATFDSEINDGYDNYGAGSYSYEYMVHVGGAGPSANRPARRPVSLDGARPADAWGGPPS